MENKFSFAKRLIIEAGQLIKRLRKEGLQIHIKSDFNDLVTSCDQQVQAFLIEKIRSEYPEDGFFAEEGDYRDELNSGRVWVIDPIDGTSNFISQGTDFAIMIAYFEEGKGQFGLIYEVMADKLYAGGGQFPVTLNDKILPNASKKPLSLSLIGGNYSMFLENQFGLADLTKQTLGLRMTGSAGLSFGRVLEGRFLAYFSYIYPWDYAAAMIMGESLGYCLLPLDKTALDFKNRQHVLFLPKAMTDVFSSQV